MFKTSFGYSEIELMRRVGDRLIKERAQASNVAVRGAVRDLTIAIWERAGLPVSTMFFWPWRLPPGWDGGIACTAMPRAIGLTGSDTNYGGYPAGTNNTTNGAIQVGGGNPSYFDMRRLRAYQQSAGSSLAARVPHAFGALLLSCGDSYLGAMGDAAPNAVVVTDIPLSSIGYPWVHPALGPYSIVTTAGQSYVTGFDNYSYRYNGSILRIESGADKGVYLVRHTDRTNGRQWLLNMDGSIFVASASATVTGWGSHRTAQMNETNVVQNSKGSIAFSGLFDPGESRNSYLLRLRFEKTGSPSPADASQKGSYWFSLRPWYHGTGRETTTPWNRYDIPVVHNSSIGFPTGSNNGYGLAYQCTAANFVGVACGAVFDRVNQRMWFITTDGTNGGVYWWKYKSPECFHEILGTAGAQDPPVSGTVTAAASNGFPRGIDIGSDNTIYVDLYGTTNAGWVSISPTFVANQVKRADVGLGSALPLGLVVDRSRYRSGGANTITTTAGNGNVLATGGAFTQADVGRAFKITGGADAGTYKISVVTDGTHITVTTLADAAVTFTGQATTGTWSIGDRIYLFFNEATTMVGKLYYFESLAWGVLQQLTITMTNGAQASGGGGGRTGQVVGCVDQATGCLYWMSSDATYQLNRYDPAQAAPAGWSRRLLTDFSKANDQTQNSSNANTATNMVDPTYIHHIAINPHPSFRELWICTDAAFIKLNPDSFAGAFSRYWGTGSEATPYQRPVGYPRPDGGWGGLAQGYSFRRARYVGFGPDGRAIGVLQGNTSDSYATYFEWVVYNRESDVWTTGHYEGQMMNEQGGSTTGTTFNSCYLVSPYGEIWTIGGGANRAVAAGACNLFMGQMEVQYQWIGGVWTPKEVVRGSLPNSSLSPGCSCKDLHTTVDDLIYGVKVQFTAQGGATPANSEFLGRLGALGPASTDGAWQSPAGGSATTQVFLGSGFVAGNVGDYVWVSASTGSGASIGVYQIMVVTNSTTVTVRNLSNTSFSPGGDAGTLTYQLWSMGDQTIPGAENVTCILGNGVARDSSQDVNGVYFSTFWAKTLLSEQQEGIKFCVDPPGPPGSPGVNVYFESYPSSVNGNYSPNFPQGIALPGVAVSKGLQAVNGALGIPLVGVNGTANFQFDNVWSNGQKAYQTSSSGWAATADLGVSAEIGSVIVRGTGGTNFLGRSSTIANLHVAPNGSAPVAASVARTSGTGLSLQGGNVGAAQSITLAYRTASLAAGDFLGTSLTTNTNGQTVSGGSRLTAVAGNFSASHLMCALKITSGSDIGVYRITNVAGDGSYVDIRNLDQTAKSFAASASGLSWEVWDAAREEDILYSATAGYMTIERLLTSNSLEVRICPHALLSNVAWTVYKPTWNLVKRVSNSVMASPPDVKNNKTFMSSLGGEDGLDDMGMWKVVLDLSDLTTAQRSGRFWKFSAMSRDTGNSLNNITVNNSNYSPSITSFELYDTNGKLVTVCKYNKVDTVDSLASTFTACHVNRIDGIQASNTAASHIAGMNGLATVGGANNNSITLAGGNSFLGFEVRHGTAGSTVGGAGAQWACDKPVADVDVGRTLRIISGPNVGLYRIATQVGGTAVTVTTNSGAAVTFAADAGPTEWSIHEGITTGHYMAIGGRESYISTISDDFKTVTVVDPLTGTGVAWEARYRLNASACDPRGQDSNSNYAYHYAADATQVTPDAKGALFFHPTQVQNMPSRSDGGTTSGSNAFTGSLFSADDVGRVLVIASGVDKGAYEIASYVSATSITVKNLYTGAATSFAATLGSLSYKVQGERRFRVSRYATVVRS